MTKHYTIIKSFLKNNQKSTIKNRVSQHEKTIHREKWEITKHAKLFVIKEMGIRTMREFFFFLSHYKGSRILHIAI